MNLGSLYFVSLAKTSCRDMLLTVLALRKQSIAVLHKLKLKMALRRSPKPGALTAATLTIPRILLTTKVANASPSISRVGKAGVITVEEGSGFDNELEVVEGMQFDRINHEYLRFLRRVIECMDCPNQQSLLLGYSQNMGIDIHDQTAYLQPPLVRYQNLSLLQQ
jgi:hypothetical protein